MGKYSKFYEVKSMGLFKKDEPTLGDLENTLQRKKTEHEIAQEEEAIQELRARGKRWQDFSTDGTRKGFSLSKVVQWLKTH